MSKSKNTPLVDSYGVQGHLVHLTKVLDLGPPRLSHLAINLRFEAIPGKDVQ